MFTLLASTSINKFALTKQSVRAVLRRNARKICSQLLLGVKLHSMNHLEEYCFKLITKLAKSLFQFINHQLEGKYTEWPNPQIRSENRQSGLTD